MKLKKSIVMVLVALFVLCTSVCFGAFSDIEGSRYKVAIEYLNQMSIIAGYEDNTYKPEKVVTRAEMAKFLVVTMGEDVSGASNETNFLDVPDWHWAKGYINIAQAKQLIKGDGDGNFRPDDTVNYGEVLTMVVRMLGYDVDVEGEGVWPNNYISRAKELKLVDNVESFTNTQGANRGSVAQVIYNAINNVYTKEEYPLVNLLDKVFELVENPNTMKDNLQYDKNTVKANLNFDIEFADEFKDTYVTDEEDEEIMNLIDKMLSNSSVDIKFKFDMIEEYAQYIIEYFFDNEEMIEAEINIDKNKVYLFVKDVFKNYLKGEQEESFFDQIFETKEVDEKQIMLLNSAKKVIFKKIVNDNKVIETTIKVNGNSKDVSKFTIIIDDEDILNIENSMYEAILQNDELLNTIIDYEWYTIEEKRELVQQIIDNNKVSEYSKTTYTVDIYIQEDTIVGIDVDIVVEYLNIHSFGAIDSEIEKDEYKFNLRIDEDNYISVNLLMTDWLDTHISYNIIVEKLNEDKYKYDISMNNKEYFNISSNGTLEFSNEEITKPNFSASVEELSEEELEKLKEKLLDIAKKMGLEKIIEDYIESQQQLIDRSKVAVFNNDAANIQDAVTLYILNYMVENEGVAPSLASNKYVITIEGIDYYEFRSEITAEELSLSYTNLSNWAISKDGKVLHKTGIKNKEDGKYVYYNNDMQSDKPITGIEIEASEYKSGI